MTSRNDFQTQSVTTNHSLISPTSSLLLVYEGKDAESERLESLNANQYDADISNCSTDLNTSHDDSHLQCSSNDENDGGIGHEDESNMDNCLYEEDESRARESSEDIDKHHLMPKNRAVSPHSMDSWLNYSNSSDDYSPQDLIVRKGTKLNLHDDEATQDTEDFVSQQSISSFKKSKMEEPSCDDTANKGQPSSNPFQFPTCTKAAECDASKLAHDTDDGIEVELEEEEEDDDQLSSLSSNIDTIIVSDTGETKFFNSSGEQEEHPSTKKKKSTCADEEIGEKKTPLTNGNHAKPTPLVDVRIIDFAHTTFSSTNPSESVPSVVSNNKVHHGPDGGFLTGIESLKRILSEIIVESI